MMSKQHLIRIFIKFLKYNQVYDSYLFRLEETRGSEESQDFIIRCIKNGPDNLIINAFTWITSSKQNKRWEDLHAEWVKFLNKNGYNIYYS